MKTLVCLLEEKSAKEMLKIILPKLFSEVNFQYITFEGKQDLLKRVRLKLINYLVPEAVFLIMCDKDNADCITLKQELEQKIPNNKKAKIRIACYELESFYLGDLQAVENAWQELNIAHYQSNKKYKNPDNLSNPVQELQRLTKKQYQKIQGSRLIAEHLKLDYSNKSNSFCALLKGVKNLVNGTS